MTTTAHKAGITVSTIHEWMRDSKFNEEYRLSMERQRSMFESAVIAIAAKGNKVIYEMMDSKDPEMKLEAAKISVNSAVRMVTRYKELQVQGFIAPVHPLVIFPAETKLPWAAKPELPMLPEAPTDIIDIEGMPVDDPEPDENE